MKSTAAKRLALFCVTCLVFLASCRYRTEEAAGAPNPDDKTDYLQYDEALTGRVKADGEPVMVAQTDLLELYVDGRTAEVMVVEKATDNRWLTNPADREQDALATGSFRDELNSQFTLQYTDSTEKVFNMNSYNDAVQYDQFTFTPLADGVRVNYQLGKATKLYLVPYIMEASRFEQYLARMDEMDAMMMSAYYSRYSLSEEKPEDQALLKQQYPIIEKYDIYALTDVKIGEELPELMLEDIQGYFIKAGYTQEDLLRDNGENGVPMAGENDVSIRLSVEYRLEDGSLTVRVPINSLIFDAAALRVTQVGCLPYFGAAGAGEEGYLLVPDGSGALVELNSKKTNISRYSKEVFGPDPTLQPETIDAPDNTAVYLPVYGVKRANHAFLAVIESGAPYATLNADVAGRSNSYNYIFPHFTVKQRVQQTDAVINLAGTSVYQQSVIRDDIALRYLFLDGDRADYAGMAAAYRDYLTGSGGLPAAPVSGGLPLHFSAVGAAGWDTTFLGMPVRAQKPLTTYAQARDMLEQLRGAGVGSLSMDYLAWANGGMDNTAPDKVKLVKELGDKAAFTELTEYAKQGGIALYPQAQLDYIAGYDAGGYNINKHSSRTLSNVPAYRRPYTLATLEADKEGRHAVVSPGRYAAYADAFAKAYEPYGNSGLGVSTLGSALTSDFNQKKYILRQQSAALAADTLAALAGQGYALSLDGANSYALAHAAQVTGLPMGSSGHYLLDRDIPFYQMVVHGALTHTSQPYNMSSDPAYMKLKLLETGSAPSFRWIYQPNTALKETSASGLYSARFDSWKDRAGALYKELSEAVGHCHSLRMTGHDWLAGEVTRTLYEDGTAVYVNYSSQPYDEGGVTVDAMDYTVVKGGAPS